MSQNADSIAKQNVKGPQSLMDQYMLHNGIKKEASNEELRRRHKAGSNSIDKNVNTVTPLPAGTNFSNTPGHHQLRPLLPPILEEDAALIMEGTPSQ